ncbi:uncharacterized protein BJ171DRAFT_496666 [Polychytrium aggregatum]|uniref:uncharacterized protein n=1 Tax=Polychytrium aggregatum TaxID=110093 RepID=UPI0022FE715C|nr:uncharacterized protein BJ171DRAFT_496666 [Polychytrium aggregatum]KAI9206723.1 hypothetical protein BJ171DRAFT_496666 [Polychytrium aggregatum]
MNALISKSTLRTTISRRSLPIVVPSRSASNRPTPNGTVGKNPYLFRQTIVHSDGSTINFKSTSPKVLIKMTKDVRNHPLWNPALNVLDDQSGEISKFKKKFGDLEFDTMGDDALGGFVEVQVAKKPAKAAPEAAAPPAQNEKKKKK